MTASFCIRNVQRKLTLDELSGYDYPKFSAGVAQLAEQLICNQQVAGSNPIASSKQKRIIYLLVYDPFLFIKIGTRTREAGRQIWQESQI